MFLVPNVLIYKRREEVWVSPFQPPHFIILINASPKSPQNIPIIAIKKNNCDSVLYGVKDSFLTFKTLDDSVCVPLKLY